MNLYKIDCGCGNRSGVLTHNNYYICTRCGFSCCGQKEIVGTIKPYGLYKSDSFYLVYNIESNLKIFFSMYTNNVYVVDMTHGCGAFILFNDVSTLWFMDEMLS